MLFQLQKKKLVEFLNAWMLKTPRLQNREKNLPVVWKRSRGGENGGSLRENKFLVPLFLVGLDSLCVNKK